MIFPKPHVINKQTMTDFLTPVTKDKLAILFEYSVKISSEPLKSHVSSIQALFNDVLEDKYNQEKRQSLDSSLQKLIDII